MSARDNFCYLMIAFANSLDTDQAWHNVRPDLDPNCPERTFLNKLILKKSTEQWTRNHEKLLNKQQVNSSHLLIGIKLEQIHFYYLINYIKAGDGIIDSVNPDQILLSLHCYSNLIKVNTGVEGTLFHR